MRKRIKKVVKKSSESSGPIKFKIDARTFVTVKDMDTFEVWRTRFPDAIIVQ